LIGFFGLNDEQTVHSAILYMRITCGLILFSFLNQTLTGLFTAVGDSQTPFMANVAGLAVNMILDPLLIFGIGSFSRMEAVGAAMATVTAQMVVTVVMVSRAMKEPVLLNRIHLSQRTEGRYLKEMFRLGLPSSLQSMLYCGISMVLTRLVASWGDAAVAVQRVGGQVECISWMTAEGFGSAMNAFTGQNFGAGFYERMKKGYKIALSVISAWGFMTSCILIFGAKPIFTLFIQEPEVLPIGIDYLVILGLGQMFMCQELMTGGALQGMGKTLSCSVITIVLTASRIPLAILLVRMGMGLNGIWWALTLTSVAKGIVFVGYYTGILRQLPKAGKNGAKTG
jgi:putative MATE family efflux protein